MTRLLALGIALATLLPGAALAHRSSTAPEAARCGAPSPVASYTKIGRGAALGPLVLRFDDGASRAEQLYEAGFPTRVVIRGRAVRADPLILRGYQCATGLPLRFWYRDAPLTFPLGFPTTDEALRAKGDFAVRFPATKEIGGAHVGYMLFWDTGNWRFVLSAGRTTVASVVVRVTE
ncbi:MAG: hypothetical protein M3540_07450 [Actinomycetota bacterium]|nr:hypothetical protein [Actinomycetota bacterium]